MATGSPSAVASSTGWATSSRPSRGAPRRTCRASGPVTRYKSGALNSALRSSSNVHPPAWLELESSIAFLQIISVDSMPLSSATHREAVNVISSRLRMMLRSTVPAASMTLEVVSTGVIPVKEKRGDPVTWMQVANDDEEDFHNEVDRCQLVLDTAHAILHMSSWEHDLF